MNLRASQLIFLLLLVSCPGFAQFPDSLIISPFFQQGARSRLHSDSLELDMNNDGFPDSLITGYDGGSWFGNSTVQIKDGKTNARFRIDNGGGFGDIFGVVQADSAMFSSDNAAFKDVAESLLLPSQKRKSVDGGLRWYLDFMQTNKVAPDSSIFRSTFHIAPFWYKGPITWSSDYSIEVSPSNANRISIEQPVDTYCCPVELNYGWINWYSSLMYRQPHVESSNTSYELVRNGNALILRDSTKHMWLYASGHTEDKFGGIHSAELKGHYVIITIQETSDPTVTCIINTRTGKGGILKDETAINDFGRIENWLNL